jgi:hypothetical protein
MSGDNRVAPAAADRDGGALIPVFVADPSHVHGEHPLSGTRSRNEDAVSVERFFQQELASLSPDFTVRRGVHSEGTGAITAPPPLSLSVRALDGGG